MLTYEGLRRACTSTLADRGELDRLNDEETRLLERGSLGVLFEERCEELERRARFWNRVVRAGAVALVLAALAQLLPARATLAAVAPLPEAARAGPLSLVTLGLLALAVAFARCQKTRARRRREIYGTLRDATSRFSLLLQER